MKFSSFSLLLISAAIFQCCNGDWSKSGGQSANQLPAAPTQNPAQNPAPLPPRPDYNYVDLSKGVDTAYGLKGADRCIMAPGDYKDKVYIYQHYTVKTRPYGGAVVGESIAIFSEKDSVLMSNPDGKYFHGMFDKFLFLDQGTGPNNRNLIILNAATKQVVYQTQVFGEETQVLSNGKVWYYAPVTALEIKKMPDCPQKGEWEAQGFTVGYGQRCVYDLNTGSVIKKGEYTCGPLQ